MWENPKRVQQAIKRLNEEIGEIEAAIYAPGEDDPVLIAGMLERQRDDIVRSAVLQLHTSAKSASRLGNPESDLAFHQHLAA
jgi:hypothetical protein